MIIMNTSGEYNITGFQMMFYEIYYTFVLLSTKSDVNSHMFFWGESNWGNNSVIWYSNNNCNIQSNALDKTYYYIAIG